MEARGGVEDRACGRLGVVDPELAPLEKIAAEDGPAADRLRRWLVELSKAKRKKALDDPELFATYIALVTDAREVVDRHVEHLVAQIAQILADGVERGEFVSDDPHSAARAIFDATARFHNPAFASQWSEPGLDDALDSVWLLLLGGLQQRDRAGGRVGVR